LKELKEQYLIVLLFNCLVATITAATLNFIIFMYICRKLIRSKKKNYTKGTFTTYYWITSGLLLTLL
ncbi:MAG: hypothetical protein DRR06_03585, partial [Gammaproteobacteria bacterium]